MKLERRQSLAWVGCWLYIVPAYADWIIDNPTSMGKRRIGHGQFEYSYCADLANTREIATSAITIVSNTTSNTVTLDGKLNFGNTVPVSARTLARTDFLLRQDRVLTFGPGSLSFLIPAMGFRNITLSQLHSLVDGSVFTENLSDIDSSVDPTALTLADKDTPVGTNSTLSESSALCTPSAPFSMREKKQLFI